MILTKRDAFWIAFIVTFHISLFLILSYMEKIEEVICLIKSYLYQHGFF